MHSLADFSPEGVCYMLVVAVASQIALLGALNLDQIHESGVPLGVKSPKEGTYQYLKTSGPRRGARKVAAYFFGFVLCAFQSFKSHAVPFYSGVCSINF